MYEVIWISGYNKKISLGKAKSYRLAKTLAIINKKHNPKTQVFIKTSEGHMYEILPGERKPWIVYKKY